MIVIYNIAYQKRNISVTNVTMLRLQSVTFFQNVTHLLCFLLRLLRANYTDYMTYNPKRA